MHLKMITDYLYYCEHYKKLSKHSIRAYRTDLTQFFNSNITDAQEYVHFLTEHTKKTSTLKRKIASLKSFYIYLKNQGYIEYNPLENLRVACRREKALPKTISHVHLQKIYTSLHSHTLTAKTPFALKKAKRNLLCVSLLISTGLRISELCQLPIQHIDLNSRLITIKGKGNKERILYIGNDAVFKLLRDYIDSYVGATDSFLFIGKDTKHPLTEQSIRLMLHKISRQLNLEKVVTPHMFRHSFATMLLDQNVDIRHIQHLLGHSSIAITQIYTHVSQAKQQEILKTYNPINQIL